ncbi:MAG TPA: ABC transporter substrate-binding protein [Gemmatimonadaceae bacterium]|nr:ABC transporter substrate-binding protein [Gemmatimonadaceae bacterium]
MRAIALLPAATEIIAALGGLDRLVGVTHECDHPPAVRHLPRVAASVVDPAWSAAQIDAAVREQASMGAPLFRLDEALIARLEPDVIFTQAVCDVCAVSESDVRALATRLPSAPSVVTLRADSFDGVFADIERVGEAIGLPEEAVELVMGLRTRLGRVHDTLRRAHAPRPRAMVIEWLDPVFVAGHWVPEIVRRAGGVPLLVQPGEHSRTSTPREVQAFAPEVLLIAPCGFRIERAARDARATLASEDWHWTRDRRVWALDGNGLTSRPGPRLVNGVETVARIFHPDLFPPPSAADARSL